MRAKPNLACDMPTLFITAFRDDPAARIARKALSRRGWDFWREDGLLRASWTPVAPAPDAPSATIIPFPGRTK